LEKPFSFPVADDDFHKSSKSQLTNSCVAVARKSEGVAVRDTKDPEGKTLFFSHEEWNAFTDGVKAGEFGE
jgi:hypothetical protein